MWTFSRVRKMSEPSLRDLLVEHREPLAAFLRRRGSGLLRFESLEDLVQGVHLRALREAPNFEWQGEKEFFAWLYTLARRQIAERHAYWSALKRGSGRVLRFTYTGGGTGAIPFAAAPAGTAAGPATFAARREMIVLATRALATLPERDRQLVTWATEGLELEEQARRLRLSYAAVQRAGLRAQERFRKAFELLTPRAEG